MTHFEEPYRDAMVEWAKELEAEKSPVGPILAMEIRRRIKVADIAVGRIEEDW